METAKSIKREKGKRENFKMEHICLLLLCGQLNHQHQKEKQGDGEPQPVGISHIVI